MPKIRKSQPGTGYYDARYLKLDSSNSPTTGTLLVGKSSSMINSTSPLKVATDTGNICMALRNEVVNRWTGIHYYKSDGTLVGHVSYGNASAPLWINQMCTGTVGDISLVLATNDIERLKITGTGTLSFLPFNSAGILKNNASGVITGGNTITVSEVSDIATNYLKLDQSTPQTLTASPIFNAGTSTRVPYYNTNKTLTDNANLTFNGTTLITTGLEVNGTITGANDETIANSTDGQWVFGGNIWLNNAGSTITFNESTDVVLTGGNEKLTLTGALQTSLGISSRGTVPLASASFHSGYASTTSEQTGFSFTGTSTTGTCYAVNITPGSSAGISVGVGGYAVVNGTATGTGLGFGTYTFWNSVTTSNLVGASVFGWGQYFAGTSSITTVVGMEVCSLPDSNFYSTSVAGWDTTKESKITLGTAISMYVHSITATALAGLTTEKCLEIELPSKATNNYQVILQGTGAGSGIWLGGTSNFARIFASAASTLDLAIGTASQVQLIDGVLQPTADNDIDLGTSSLEYKNFYLQGKFVQNAITQVVSGSKALTDGSATGFFKVSLANTQMVGGTVHYTIYVSNATPDYQTHSGSFTFAAINKAGVYATDIDEVYLAASETLAATSGTLTDAFTITTGTNEITVNCNANSSLDTPTITIKYEIHLHSTNLITQL